MQFRGGSGGKRSSQHVPTDFDCMAGCAAFTELCGAADDRDDRGVVCFLCRIKPVSSISPGCQHFVILRQHVVTVLSGYPANPCSELILWGMYVWHAACNGIVIECNRFGISAGDGV